MTPEQDSAAPLHLEKRLVFLHIAKTAGTSLVEYLRRLLPPGAVLSHGDFLEFPNEDLSTERMRDYQVISGHFGYAHIHSYLGDSHSVTFLRDPIARVLSFYRFCMHPDMQRKFPVAKAARDLTIDGFFTSTLPEVSEALDNLQVWQLADMYWYRNRQRRRHCSDSEMLALAEQHLAEFSYVGFTDRFALDFVEILQLLKLPVPAQIPREFVTPEPVRLEQLKPATQASLRDRLALDLELYVRARQRVNSA